MRRPAPLSTLKKRSLRGEERKKPISPDMILNRHMRALERIGSLNGRGTPATCDSRITLEIYQ